jgi:hypothetical protein
MIDSATPYAVFIVIAGRMPLPSSRSGCVHHAASNLNRPKARPRPVTTAVDSTMTRCTNSTRRFNASAGWSSSELSMVSRATSVHRHVRDAE